jgi:hypothetical protein
MIINDLHIYRHIGDFAWTFPGWSVSAEAMTSRPAGGHHSLLSLGLLGGKRSPKISSWDPLKIESKGHIPRLSARFQDIQRTETLVPSNSASFVFPHCSRRKSVPGSQESGGLDVEYVLLKVAATGFHIGGGPGRPVSRCALSHAPREQKKSSVKSNLTQNAALYRLTCPIPRFHVSHGLTFILLTAWLHPSLEHSFTWMTDPLNKCLAVMFSKSPNPERLAYILYSLTWQAQSQLPCCQVLLKAP